MTLCKTPKQRKTFGNQTSNRLLLASLDSGCEGELAKVKAEKSWMMKHAPLVTLPAPCLSDLATLLI